MSANKNDPKYGNTDNKTNDLPKNRAGLFATAECVLHEDLDKDCLYEFKDPLVRIEFPGHVKNVEKAIELLGGVEEIQKALTTKKLELSFHKNSFLSRGCVADVDNNLCILIKVKQKADSEDVSYEVIGVTDTNFKYNRMCDFQYLPLRSKSKSEEKESDVTCVYDKIVSDKIPSMEWFTNKKEDGDDPFLVNCCYARFDLPQIRFSTNNEQFLGMVRGDAPCLTEKKTTKRKFLSGSIRVSLHKHEVPDQPLPQALENLQTEFLKHQYNIMLKLFEERPVWTSSGIMHRGKINHDSAKQCLPCVAYFCPGGPFRSCWIKLGYNPVKDYNSRIYQILDFRIRHSQGFHMKIQRKNLSTIPSIARRVARRTITYTNINESHYVIKPNQIPPARQMNYQYCDILLPEVQEMLTKLPKLPLTAKFDPKNGWLPLSFQEHCREMVNRYIFEAVQEEIRTKAKTQAEEQKPENVANYCSKMLNNIKLGLSQSMGEYSRASTSRQESIIEEIYLSDEEEMDANEVTANLPERLPEDFTDEEEENSESDLEIDMEAVEEVNQLVADFKTEKH